MTLDKNIIDRLDVLTEDCWQYNKRSIINQLLDDALSKYGY